MGDATETPHSTGIMGSAKTPETSEKEAFQVINSKRNLAARQEKLAERLATLLDLVQQLVELRLKRLLVHDDNPSPRPGWAVSTLVFD